MRSNYRRIGDFIELVDERNKDLSIDLLLGLTVNKLFIPSVANTIGADMANYKIIRKGQFACSIMQVRRDKKMPVALLSDHDEAIISQAYPVFRVKDESELLPEYLMMWFSRSEFDREACFHAVGGVRGSLEWEDFLNMELPIPSIEKQREIVKEYNTVVNRIKLNEQLNQKLEETAQALYKHWFVDFEFPNENGEPYKSSGGKMVYNSELDKEIPEGWESRDLGGIVESHSKKHDFKKKELIFFNTSDILEGDFLHNNYMAVDSMPGQAKKSIRKKDILYSEIRPANKRYALVRIDAEDYVVSTKLMVIRLLSDEFKIERIYQYLTYPPFIEELHHAAEGRSGTFPQITFEEHLEQHKFIIADKQTELKWEKFLVLFYQQFFARRDELFKLKELQNIVLSKMTKVEQEKEMVN